MTARILNVDDDEAGRYVTTRLLRHAGFEVVEAARGLDAIERARASRPDLVLLDVNLPDISGHEVCGLLRADPEFGNVPVLMLSASCVTGADRVRGLVGGADAYLTEPIDSSELVAVINALLRMRQAEHDVVDLNRALKGKIQELETTIETLPIGLAIAGDRDGVEVRGNAAMASLVGLPSARGSSEAAPDDSYLVRLDGKNLPIDDLPLQRAAKGEVVRDEEREIVRPDGTSIVVYGHASPLYDADGGLCGAVGAFMDVTERKASELRQRVLADITELLAEGLDLDKTLVGVAHVAVRHLADWCVIDTVRSDDELQRVAVIHRDPEFQNLADRIREEHGPDRRRSAAIYDALATGKGILVREIDAETRAKIRNDPSFASLMEMLGLRSYISTPLVARGRSLGVLTLVRTDNRYDKNDLSVATELAARAALALDNALLFRAAEEANRAKDDFFAMISHELRTPLTAIVGWATMLNSISVDEETRRTGMAEIQRSAQSQARLIDDLLDTARISAGKIHLELRKVSLDSVIDESVALVHQVLAEKHIGVTSSSDASAIVSGDRQRLVQVASNLLTNAAKFTPQGGRIDTSVSVDRETHTASFSIRDNGQGISPEFLPHVFDRFSQEREKASRLGLGLGLSIVKSFVELHGGDVTVNSEGEGKGSEFTVRLPLAAAVGASR